MQLIVTQNEDIIERVRNLVHNVGLFIQAKHLQQQLSPIAQALDAFQSGSANIVDAYKHWLNLTQCPVLEPYHDKLHECFDHGVIPSHFVANLLYPIYRSKKLKADHINAAQELLVNRNPDLVADLLSFISDNSSLP